MSAPANVEKISRLIETAAAALAKASTAAEVLDVRDKAAAAYDQAKSMAHLGKIRKAHDTIIQACHKAQADALEIEAKAQCRLADEYDNAQKRGEVRKHGRSKNDIPNENITFVSAAVDPRRRARAGVATA